MAHIDIGSYSIQEGDVDVNLNKIDSKDTTVDQREEWEINDKYKFGHLNKDSVGSWDSVRVEIKGSIDSKDVTHAIAIIHCRWTNHYDHVELKETEKKEGKVLFSGEKDLYRTEVASKAIIYIKYLKDNVTVGLSPEFSIFVDNREGPPIDSGLFSIKDAKFKKEDKEEIIDNKENLEFSEQWNEMVDIFKGEEFFSSMTPPGADGKITLFYNTSFPGITSELTEDIDSFAKEEQVIYKLFSFYLQSGAFVSLCTSISFYLSELNPGSDDEREEDIERNATQENSEESKNKVYTSIVEELSGDSSTLHHDAKFVLSLATELYPEFKKDDKEALFRWWESCNQNGIYSVLERVHMAYQKLMDPENQFKEDIKDLFRTDVEEEEPDV